MGRQLAYIAAINEAISQEMTRDSSVLYFGQNIATTENDEFLRAFGSDRVRVTPISETAEIGMAVGAALAGYRPVVELYMAEFMLVAMDQVVNEAPRFRYMSGGRVTVPLVLKAGYGFTAGWAGQHTGSIYGMFTGVPGLKVALPATPADAKGLMATAIRDDNPVCFFHHYLLTLEEGEVPEGEYLVPFGQADVRRAGDDVTIVATGAMVGRALATADALAASGVAAEIDVARVPFSQAARTAIAADPALIETALTGGDDYEIVLTLKPEKLSTFFAAADKAGVAVTEIGRIMAGEGARFIGDGKPLAFERSSYSHF